MDRAWNQIWNSFDIKVYAILLFFFQSVSAEHNEGLYLSGQDREESKTPEGCVHHHDGKFILCFDHELALQF